MAYPLKESDPYNPHNLPLKHHHLKVAELVYTYVKDGDTVLDVGCRVGRTLFQISQGNASLTLSGADFDELFLSIAKEGLAGLLR